MNHPAHHQAPFITPPAHDGELILIRHGQSEANAQGIAQGRADYPLSERGRAQARLTAEHLRELGGVAAIYSSPLARAAETARIIADALGLEVTYLDDMAEADVGAFSGITWDELRQRHPEAVAAYEHAEKHRPHPKNRELLPGWEPIDQIVDRIWRVLMETAHRHPGERVVAVSHGAVLNAYLTHLLTGDARETPWPHSSSNCAITRVTFTDGGPQATCLTDDSHLAALATSRNVFFQSKEETP